MINGKQHVGGLVRTQATYASAGSFSFPGYRECCPRVATARDDRGDILWLAAGVKEFLGPAVLLDPPRSAMILASRNCASRSALVGENQEPECAAAATVVIIKSAVNGKMTHSTHNVIPRETVLRPTSST